MTTQTYSEARGHARFDWRAWLERAIKEEPGDESHIKAVNSARKWVTCAVGNQCSVIPRNENGLPKDDQLRELGIDFHDRIRTRSYRHADAVLDLIEARSYELIAGIEGRGA